MTVIPLNAGRMTEEQYAAERAKLPASKKEAGIKFEQALALLFDRSGWTQEQLAEKETAFSGKKVSPQHIARLVRFGRFLTFSPFGENPKSLPRNLSEGQFRSYWEQTDKHQNERARFSEIMRMLPNDLEIHRARRPAIVRTIVEKFGDGQWYDPQEIADDLQTDVSHIQERLESIRKGQVRNVKCENKQVGTEFHYRIFHSEKQVSIHELAEKLRPIIQKLKIEGKRSPATASPPSVAILAGQLEKLLEKWMQ